MNVDYGDISRFKQNELTAHCSEIAYGGVVRKSVYRLAEIRGGVST